jgi:hypothetical protein
MMPDMGMEGGEVVLRGGGGDADVVGTEVGKGTVAMDTGTDMGMEDSPQTSLRGSSRRASVKTRGRTLCVPSEVIWRLRIGPHTLYGTPS